MKLSDFTKKELQELGKYYGEDFPYYLNKDKMIKRLEALLEKEVLVQQEMEVEEVQMSARVRRIKEQNDGS
jgi:hypothetical protein